MLSVPVCNHHSICFFVLFLVDRYKLQNSLMSFSFFFQKNFIGIGWLIIIVTVSPSIDNEIVLAFFHVQIVSCNMVNLKVYLQP